MAAIPSINRILFKCTNATSFYKKKKSKRSKRTTSQQSVCLHVYTITNSQPISIKGNRESEFESEFEKSRFRYRRKYGSKRGQWEYRSGFMALFSETIGLRKLVEKRIALGTVCELGELEAIESLFEIFGIETISSH